MNRKTGIIYSDPDEGYAQELADRIGPACGVAVEQAALSEGECFLDAVDRLWDARFLIVLLRAESAPHPWIGEQWQQMFWTEPHSGGVHTCCIETAPCHVPQLLKARRSRHVYLSRGDEQALRRWIVEALGADSPEGFVPANEPIKGCNEADLQVLARDLVDRPGIALLTGESGLAFEFVRRHEEDFERVWWFACHGLSFTEVLSEAARSAGLPWRGHADDVIATLHREWGKRRCLIVLDGVCSEVLSIAVRGIASTLITTEDAQADLPERLTALEGDVDWTRLELRDAFIAIRALLSSGANWSLTRELTRHVSRALEACGHTTLQAEILRKVTHAAWDAGVSEVWESTARDLAAVLEDRGEDREAEVWRRRLRSGPAQQLELFDGYFTSTAERPAKSSTHEG